MNEPKFRFYYLLEDSNKVYTKSDFSVEDLCNLVCDGNINKDFYELVASKVYQFTGKKDCNYINICQKDIVSIEGHGLAVIEFGEYHTNSSIKTNLGFYIDWVNKKSKVRQDFLFWDQGEIEIVGNVYENCELLEDVS